MSKLLVGLALVGAALGTPVISFAQTNHPLTRAEVRADLERIEQAGYNPSRGGDAYYPNDIQAAEAKIAAEDAAKTAQEGVGGVAQSGGMSSGAPARTSTQAGCVGPVSFCNLYSGS